MGEAVRDGRHRVCDSIGTIHWLEPEVIKTEGKQVGRVEAGLRIDKLQLLSASNPQRRAGLRTDANPIDSINRFLRAVCLDRDFKSQFVDGADQSRIELQQRLPAREYDELSWPIARPGPL